MRRLMTYAYSLFMIAADEYIGLRHAWCDTPIYLLEYDFIRRSVHMLITLGKDIIEACRKFAKRCAEHERPANFGNKEAAVREIETVASDTFIGKLGEVAFQQALLKYGISAETNFDMLPRGVWDKNDFDINGWNIDVKCTRNLKDFLIEWNKLQFRIDSGELPQLFVMTRIASKIAIDSELDSCEVECVGYFYTCNLKKDTQCVMILKKGDIIPGSPSVRTKSRSFCVPFANLEKDWDALARRLIDEKPYDLGGYHVPGRNPGTSSMPDVRDRWPKIRYSLLISGKEAEKITSEELEHLVMGGAKVLAFVQEKGAGRYAALAGRLEKKLEKIPHSDIRNHLCLYTLDKGEVPNLKIIDGRLDPGHDAFDRLCRLPWKPAFNHEQYIVEHADTRSTMIVKASAGTGKTTVMIDRIMYLLSTQEHLKPADIGMVTFTNKAATSMTDKLQFRLMDMYGLTKAERYRTLLEQLSAMQISTIDSFFKDILGRESACLGYGRNASMRALTYDKERILVDVIDELFQKKRYDEYADEEDSDFLDHSILNIHDYVRLSLKIWNQLHAQGIFRDAIYDMDFGTCKEAGKTAEKNNIVNQNLKYIISEAERRYQDFKVQNNVYDLDDIKANMDQLADRGGSIVHSRHFRFLFVDEFQDTDNSQIRSMAWIKESYACQLFVVGDVKQSIYRFRGAEESAFDELERRLLESGDAPSSIKNFILTKNYRTSGVIMDEFNRLFGEWGGRGILIWDKDAESCIDIPGALEIVRIPKKNFWGFSTQRTVEMIKDIIRKEKGKGTQLTVLCRNNASVSRIADECRKRNIPCTARLNGGFFQSAPVRDFFALVGALLYPQDPRRLFNLTMTPYTRNQPDVNELISMNGQEKEISAYLRKLLAEEDWESTLQEFRIKPFFTEIESFVQRNNPSSCWQKNYEDENDPLYKGMSCDTYMLNLNKLMRILYEHFAGEYASALEVYDFLKIKIATDHSSEDIDYPEPEGRGTDIQAMTVHKAKGLEFDTVIIPFTTDSFSHDKSHFGFVSDNRSTPVRVGWYFDLNQSKSSRIMNDHYRKLYKDECRAVQREEARLLYVAMTRAKKRLILLVPDEPKDDTWSEYLKDVREVTGRV